MILDPYGRPILNLRVSVIDSCNLECFYYHREGYCPTEGLTSKEKIILLAEVASKLGVRYVKITEGSLCSGGISRRQSQE